MIPAWEAGKTYAPGALVHPASATAPTTSPVPNGGFESGTTSWDFPDGWSVQTDVVYSGTHSAKFLGNGVSSLTNTSKFPVVPGQSITASVMVALDWIAAHQASGRILILWYNDANAPVGYNAGNLIDNSHNGAWQKSSVTASAPAGALAVRPPVRKGRGPSGLGNVPFPKRRLPPTADPGRPSPSPDRCWRPALARTAGCRWSL